MNRDLPNTKPVVTSAFCDNVALVLKKQHGALVNNNKNQSLVCVTHCARKIVSKKESDKNITTLVY